MKKNNLPASKSVKLKETTKSSGSSKIKIPSLSRDQKEYIDGVLKWKKESYKPSNLIGGPAIRRVD